MDPDVDALLASIVTLPVPPSNQHGRPLQELASLPSAPKQVAALAQPDSPTTTQLVKDIGNIDLKADMKDNVYNSDDE